MKYLQFFFIIAALWCIASITIGDVGMIVCGLSFYDNGNVFYQIATSGMIIGMLALGAIMIIFVVLALLEKI